jgi:large subunit ribosomal protein L15
MSKSKVDRLRGHRTHGKGSTKNHRGSGSNGGRGRAGAFKHKRGKFLPYVNFNTKIRLKAKTKLVEINLNDLDKLAGNNKELDLSKFGIDKILGSGNITKALIIKNAKYTAAAKAKIEKAGGKLE